MQKNILELKKKKKKKKENEIMKLRKKIKIEKNVSESRNILLQESRKNLESNDFQFNELYLFYKIKE